MNKRIVLDSPWVIRPGDIGPAMKEVAIDYIQVNNQKVTSRWLKAEDVELFVWTDEMGNIIKQQMSLLGLVVEWNIYDGVRTGLIIESDLDTGDKVSENVKFDTSPQSQSISQVTAILKCVSILSEADRNALIENFSQSPRRKQHFTLRGWLRKLFS